MAFNSILFLVFLPLVLVIYYLTSTKHRWLVLLLAGYVFIASRSIESLLIMVASTAINYYIAILIEKSVLTRGKMLYYLGVGFNVLLIILFKYIETSTKGVNINFHTISFQIEATIIALGFSFYTLQNISYLTDVYRKQINAEHNIGRFGLYVNFFPKIFAGPIELAQDFLPQTSANKKIEANDIAFGMQRIIIGFFKKLVIADNIAAAVNVVFDTSDISVGLITLTGIYLFTIQLYFDFSGYTDIALGIARMFGYNLKENFNQPFKATSISDFWRRWHISLIQWLTNYLYYPVVYRFRNLKKLAAVIGLVVTFLISGVWHGIGITFLLWSACHAIYLVFEVLTKNVRSKFSSKISGFVYKPLSILITFNLVCFSNMFFRAGSFHNAVSLMKNVFVSNTFMPKGFLYEFIGPLAARGGGLESIFNVLFLFCIIILYFLFENKMQRAIYKKNVSFVLMFFLIIAIMIFGVFNSGEQFIYIQF